MSAPCTTPCRTPDQLLFLSHRVHVCQSDARNLPGDAFVIVSAAVLSRRPAREVPVQPLQEMQVGEQNTGVGWHEAPLRLRYKTGLSNTRKGGTRIWRLLTSEAYRYLRCNTFLLPLSSSRSSLRTFCHLRFLNVIASMSADSRYHHNSNH